MNFTRPAVNDADAVVPAIIASSEYRAVIASFWRHHDRFIEELVMLTQIPAPPFREAVRGEAYRDLLEAAGLEEVGIDEIGNVTGIRRGTSGGQRLVAVSAHLDTVFPDGTDVTVRREGDRLLAPGVGDNTRGLATILAYLRALDDAGVRTRDDILVLATVGEEGAGNLRGMRHFFAVSPYRQHIAALVCLDGPTPPSTIVRGATGSKRYEVTFRGPGGHSFADHGVVNPMIAAARAILELGRIPLPVDPKTTCNSTVIQGGSSVNAIPANVSLLVDLRSNSAVELAKLDGHFHEIIAQACRFENEARSVEKGAISVEIDLIGDRPAGMTIDGDLTRFAAAAILATGEIPVFESFSTDANIAMSLGIPAVTLTFGGDGGNAHTTGEWTDIEAGQSIRGMAIGMTVLLASAGAEISLQTQE